MDQRVIETLHLMQRLSHFASFHKLNDLHNAIQDINLLIANYEKNDVERSQAIVDQLGSFNTRFEAAINRMRNKTKIDNCRAMLHALENEIPVLIELWNNFTKLKAVIVETFYGACGIYRKGRRKQAVKQLVEKLSTEGRKVMSLKTVPPESIEAILEILTAIERIFNDDEKSAEFIESQPYVNFKESIVRLELAALLDL